LRILVQRVTEAAVTVDDAIVGEIDAGLLLLVGIAAGDTPDLAPALCEKVANLRIFEDDDGRMNHSLLDLLAGETVPGVLVVSQFTLYGDVRKGRRPSFSHAAQSAIAAPMIDACAAWFRAAGVRVGMGEFGAHMRVHLVNDGPVTLWVDSDDLRRPRRG